MTDAFSLPDNRTKCEFYMMAAEGGAGYIGGWWSVKVIGELLGALGAQLDGDLALLAHHNLDFVEPIYVGDCLRFRGEIVKIGKTSRTVDIVVHKVIDSRPDLPGSAADYLEEPRVVVKGQSVIVIGKDKQRKPI